MDEDYSSDEGSEYVYSDDEEEPQVDDDDTEEDVSLSTEPMEMESWEDGRDGKSRNKRSASGKSPSMIGRRRADNNPNAAPVGGSGGSGGGMGMDFSVFGDAKDGSAIRMLKSSELICIMKQRLKEVTEVLDIPASAAAVLMREHGWAKERLFEVFYNDPEKVQKSVGVLERCRNCYTKKPALPASSKRRHCEICYEESGFTPEEMLSMPCGHEFCRDCWRGFVECALTTGPACVKATCPQAGCTEVVTEEEVKEAAPDLLPKFESYQLRSFVEMNGMTRWCPGPGCERVAVGCGAGGLFGATAAGVAECDDCGTCFCLKCGEEPHAPVTCRDLVKWNEKCRNESETANWILANTKPCPKCSSRIEKNQGCNHMSCQQCKHEFCWICMGDWNDHGANTGGYYKCNKYDSDNNDEDQSDAARAKRELDRYLHYYKRYHAHSEAQKFAKRQLRETEARMVLLQESSNDSTWTDVEFLKTANEQLVECRRVLKYTYSFAYYLTDDKSDKSKLMQKERFEHHQEMLERFTENLSELSEKPLAEMDRTDVVNQTRVVDRFMKNILKYVDDGMEED
uniref:RBR-type E3 ubiquitin transferase n=1 Tax=Ditylum brightwellii TaxID=49249 RepID=A0A7S1VX50_9STRA|mmetsp:Transcript_10569/g.15681  ORF Transcript_10569/g.15681 Transcript_10569/m.15681 type:complete len:570 (+) Transcript_10569:190-1899(+)